jgi:predicted RNA binding protein YcfA (HicA-like mRNA interferase family)
MGHYNKLYDQISSNIKDVSFADLHKLLTKVGGFDCRQGAGDHYVFSHPDLTEIISVDSRNKGKQLKPIYVKKALAAFREVNPQFGKEGIEE